ncbi:MAG TPA: Co2+/Mg2+ efflux protein ApaG [Rhizobiales bacterium]|nr:Co2+/Mg2+ efflux protein ApaG [Hyphomicrobiales bacterium]
MYEITTRDIKVTVQPEYLVEQSKPQDSYFVWSYTIKIENLGNENVRLRARYWHITDSVGRVQEVRGEGVVGEQPVIKPGEVFKYTSGAPLATPSGFMRGSYQMEDADGQPFEVEIPAFSLDQPSNDGAVH